MQETTQGDPAAMVIYAIAIIPLILILVEIRMQENSHIADCTAFVGHYVCIAQFSNDFVLTVETSHSDQDFIK